MAQNAARLLRGLFEIVLRKNWPSMTYRLLGLCKQLDKRTWGFESPLRQFNMIDDVLLRKMEKLNLSLDKMYVHRVGLRILVLVGSMRHGGGG